MNSNKTSTDEVYGERGKGIQTHIKLSLIDEWFPYWNWKNKDNRVCLVVTATMKGIVYIILW